MNDILMSIHSKWAKLIYSGEKTVEIRLYDEKRRAVAAGDVVEFTCDSEILTCRVVALHRFRSFAELYAAEHDAVSHRGNALKKLEKLLSK